jgi:hypothetical protein
MAIASPGRSIAESLSSDIGRSPLRGYAFHVFGYGTYSGRPLTTVVDDDFAVFLGERTDIRIRQDIEHQL